MKSSDSKKRTMPEKAQKRLKERRAEFRAEVERSGLYEFRGEIVKFVQQRIPSEPTSPRKREWGVSFGLDKEGPVYVNVGLDWDRFIPQCCVTFNEPAVDAIGDSMIASLNDRFPDECYPYKSAVKCLKLALPKDKWAEMKEPLSKALERMVERADR